MLRRQNLIRRLRVSGVDRQRKSGAGLRDDRDGPIKGPLLWLRLETISHGLGIRVIQTEMFDAEDVYDRAD